MKTLPSSITLATLSLSALLITSVEASTVVESVDPSQPWIGFMNVFNLPQQGGAYQFGSSWGVSDLVATWSGPVLTLSPNVINDPSSYWYTPAGGPGSVGNKIMDANIYVQDDTLAGQTVDFSGNVLANTLAGHVDAIGNGWTSVAFVKDFAPDYSSSTSVTAPLTAGSPFDLSLPTTPGDHIQFGFETIGPDVWITDVGPYGNIQVIPEPCTATLLGLGLVGALIYRRR